MTWNTTQQIALAIVPKFTAFASILGSSWVILEVLTEVEKRRSVYHRLLLMMSVYDVLESVWNFCSTWPIPIGTPNIWGNVGTQQSCSAQGFFLQLGLAVPMYNACLSAYYLLVIRYNTSDLKLKRQVEPVMHVFSFVFPVATAFASLGLTLYSAYEIVIDLPEGSMTHVNRVLTLSPSIRQTRLISGVGSRHCPPTAKTLGDLAVTEIVFVVTMLGSTDGRSTLHPYGRAWCLLRLSWWPFGGRYDNEKRLRLNFDIRQ